MRTFIRLIWKLIDVAALTAFAIMLVLVTSQVVFRYLLEISVPWTEEAARPAIEKIAAEQWAPEVKDLLKEIGAW